MKLRALRILAALLYLSPLLLISSCGDPASRGVMVYDQNFEGAKGWCSMEHIFEGKGHSGRFSTLATATAEFSSIFRIPFKEISNKPVKYLRFSVWCYVDELPTDGILVMSVDNDTTQKIIWRSWELKNFIKTKEDWTQIDGEVNLQENNANKENNTFVFYLHSTSAKKTLADDFHLEFTSN
jgi:hypothetical protein